MKMHYYVVKLDKNKDDLFKEGTHSTECGKRIPFDHITNTVSVVSCKTCLISLQKFAEEGIKDLQDTIHQLRVDAITANDRLMELNK